MPEDTEFDAFADAPLRILEDDENIPPRPEEEVAQVARSEPDPH